MSELIISLTGHRPDKIGREYNNIGPYCTAIKKELYKVIEIHKPKIIITGMALGCDTLWALVGIDMKIRICAAIPFVGQELKWPKESQVVYNNILKNPLVTKRIICEGGYDPRKMHIRNCFMVDKCNILVAVWNGSKGGTNNCVDYAKSESKEIIHIDPEILIRKSA